MASFSGRGKDRGSILAINRRVVVSSLPNEGRKKNRKREDEEGGPFENVLRKVRARYDKSRTRSRRSRET